MGRKEEIERGGRGLRAWCALEMPEHDVATAARLLAALPKASRLPSVLLRLAAAGRELIDLRKVTQRTREMVEDGELPLRSPDDEGRVLTEVLRGLGELVARIEEHLGAFPQPDAKRPRSGVREIFLVEIDPEHHESARWAVENAYRESDAPAPPAPLGSLTLAALGDDLREVERFLAALPIDEGSDDLRALVHELASGCGELAGAVAGVLRPAAAGGGVVR